MRLLDLARSRRSIRHFKVEDISLRDLAYILNVARHAPSGANRQPWRFLIVLSGENKKNLRRLCERVEKRLHEGLEVGLKTGLKRGELRGENSF